MAKVKQTRNDIIQYINEQLVFLKSSARAFDNGQLSEAKRLAVTIRTLLHDTGNSHSLLGQLGWKHEVRFLDTATYYHPESLTSYHGLVGLKSSDSGQGYFPLCEEPMFMTSKKSVNFNEWWSKIVIYDYYGIQFKRYELILALANKLGGAHVDPELKDTLLNLTKNNSVGWVSCSEDEQTPMLKIELYTVRQIAYEVIISLQEHLRRYNLIKFNRYSTFNHMLY